MLRLARNGETIEPMAITLDSLLDQQIHVITVSGIEENILSPVTPKHYVIDPAWDMQPWLSAMIQ